MVVTKYVHRGVRKNSAAGDFWLVVGGRGSDERAVGALSLVATFAARRSIYWAIGRAVSENPAPRRAPVEFD
jgi:hypothetical protein